MIQKEKYNAKKILALILSLACVTGLLAGCGRQNTSEGKADGSSLEEQTSDTWYEIDQEAGIPLQSVGTARNSLLSGARRGQT